MSIVPIIANKILNIIYMLFKIFKETKFKETELLI